MIAHGHPLLLFLGVFKNGAWNRTAFHTRLEVVNNNHLG